jgi:hypothetical protein
MYLTPRSTTIKKQQQEIAKLSTDKEEFLKKFKYSKQRQKTGNKKLKTELTYEPATPL